jgi:hypothetical protein
VPEGEHVPELLGRERCIGPAARHQEVDQLSEYPNLVARMTLRKLVDQPSEDTRECGRRRGAHRP